MSTPEVLRMDAAITLVHFKLYPRPPLPIRVVDRQPLNWLQLASQEALQKFRNETKCTKNTMARTQQNFTLHKADATYGKQPTKGERFCKNLACHLSDPPKSRRVFQYLRQRIDTVDEPPQPDCLDLAVLGEIDPTATARLTREEINFCQAERISMKQYCEMKARIFFGWACIIEQNIRGGSNALRQCHPFLGGEKKFRCINLGPSQAQWLCRGHDANKASAICRKLQEWQWLPRTNCFEDRNGAVTVSEHVEQQFPSARRCAFLQFAATWDEDDKVPGKNSMVVGREDLLGYTNSTGENWICSCASGTTHGSVSFTLPQGAKQTGRKAKRNALGELKNV